MPFDFGDARDLRDRCAIVGVGHSRLGKVPGVSSLDLLIEAMKNAIDISTRHGG